MVEGCKSQSPLCDLSIDEHINFYINLGFTKMDAIKKVAKDRNVAKNEIYKKVNN